MISPDTIRLVKERTDIVAVVREHVPSLKKRGRSFSGLCPFHQEKSPSFHVNPERGFFHCFGCKESGSAIDFLIKYEGYTFPEAVRALAERLGIEVQEEAQERREVDRDKQLRDDLYAANMAAAVFFQEQLKTHPLRPFAWDELARRGLDIERNPGTEGREAIAHALHAFRIGYAPAAWDGLASYFRSQGISPVVGEMAGLLVPRSSGSGHYDRFRHRLMFAVMDPQGRVIAFSGRALPDPPGSPPREEKPAKYVNSPESPVFQKGYNLFGLHQARQAIRSEQCAVVVEGNFDVVSLHARGVAHVVAPLGTAFTTDQAVLLKRFAPSVVLLFDADAAGKKATFASREPCRVAGLSARVATLPDGKDPDEFVRARGVEALRGCILQSQGLLEYLLDQCLDSTFVSADSRERAGRVEQVAKLLSEEDDPLVRSMAKAYADKLAGRLDLVRSVDAFQALERTVKRALASRAPSAAFEGDRNSRDALDTHAANVVFDPRRARIAPQAPEKRFRADMVGAIIEFPEILADSAVASELNLFEGASALTVAAVGKATRIASTGEKNLDTTVFLSQIPSAVQEFALKRLAAPLYETAEVAKTNFLQKASLLRRLILSRETEEISRSQQKVQGDWQAEVELAQEAYERMRQKHGLPPQRSPIPTNATNSTNSRNATQSIESNATQSTDDDDDNP